MKKLCGIVDASTIVQPESSFFCSSQFIHHATTHTSNTETIGLPSVTICEGEPALLSYWRNGYPVLVTPSATTIPLQCPVVKPVCLLYALNHITLSFHIQPRYSHYHSADGCCIVCSSPHTANRLHARARQGTLDSVVVSGPRVQVQHSM